jgi:pimeloyl-ACP methyl ester carboxylesterase
MIYWPTMTYVWLTLGWLFSVIFGVLTVSMLLMNNWLPAAVLLLVVLLVLPPVSSLIRARFNWPIHILLRFVLIAVLLFVFLRLLTGGERTSIYNSPEVKARFMEIYDEKMEQWPVAYEDVFVDTRYGAVHVIVSGPQDAPPALLLHASGVAGWSWKYNVEQLNQRYRTYAIDLIGDAGKSEYTSLGNIMKTGRDQAELYTEITDKLGVEKAYVVGASEGGFIGSNYALHFPGRVEKLALLGPMGYSGATKSVMRITFAQFFPLKPIQASTFRWAFSDSPKLKEEFSEWFPLLMSGVFPAKVTPLPLSAEQRQSIQVPVMFVFGERDNLVGDPEAAEAMVQDIPDVRVEIVEAGHLMGAEIPEQVNALITEFFE